MNKLIGKKVTMSATVGAYDAKRDKQCLVNPSIGTKDHLWFQPNKTWKDVKLKRGDRVEFTCIIYQYTGLIGDKQVSKVGIKKLRNIQKKATRRLK